MNNNLPTQTPIDRETFIEGVDGYLSKSDKYIHIYKFPEDSDNDYGTAKWIYHSSVVYHKPTKTFYDWSYSAYNGGYHGDSEREIDDNDLILENNPVYTQLEVINFMVKDKFNFGMTFSDLIKLTVNVSIELSEKIKET